MKVCFDTTCPTCFSPPANPYRVYRDGKVLNGCVDHFHTGHIPSLTESLRWHNRPAAKAIRAANKKARGGFVTQFAERVELTA